MRLPFTKMHGAGNDYIYVNAFEHTLKDPAEFAARLAGVELSVRAFDIVEAAQCALYSSSHGCGSPPEVVASSP